MECLLCRKRSDTHRARAREAAQKVRSKACLTLLTCLRERLYKRLYLTALIIGYSKHHLALSKGQL